MTVAIYGGGGGGTSVIVDGNVIHELRATSGAQITESGGIGQIAVPTLDNSSTVSLVRFYPSGGADDSPSLAALIASEFGDKQRTIELGPYAYNWASHVNVTEAQMSNLTIKAHPKTVLNGILPYTECWIGFPVSVAAPDTTTAAPAVEGDRVVTLTSAAGIVPGNYLTLLVAGGRAMFEVEDVAGANVTLKKPLWFNVPAASLVFKRQPVRGFRFEGNGCLFRWTFTGAFQDQRVIEMVETVDCAIVNCRGVEVAGAPQAFFGFDQGGINNTLDDIEITGLGPAVPNVDAVAFEAQYGGLVRNIRSRNINAGPWINSCFGTTVEQIDSVNVNHVIWFSTLDVANPIPNRKLTVRGVKGEAVTTTGNGFAAGQTNCLVDSDVDDVQIEAVAPGTNAGINLDGACSDIRIGKAKVSNVAIAVRGAGNGKRNTIEQLTASNIGQLAILSGSDELTIKRLDAAMATTSSVFCTVTNGGALRVLSGKVDATIAANWMLASVPGPNGLLDWAGLTITKTVGGISYGLSNAGRNGRFRFRDCDLGAWSGSEGLHPTSSRKVIGESTLSGALAIVGAGAAVNGWRNRGSITLNGVTAVPWVYPGAAATSEVRFRCTATGAGSHGPPKATLVANTTTIAAIETWVNASGGTWNGGTRRFTESLVLNETHYFFINATNYVRGPAWATGKAKPISGGHTWFVVQLGAAAYVYLNASGAGAVGATAGGAVGAISANGDGSYTWTVYVADMTSSLGQIYSAQADGVIGYIGNGSVYEFEVFDFSGLNRYDFSAEATNVDTYAFEIC